MALQGKTFAKVIVQTVQTVHIIFRIDFDLGRGGWHFM